VEVWSPKDSEKITGFLRRVSPGFAENAQARAWVEPGDRILLQIAFVKEGVAARVLETFVVKDDGGNIIRVEPPEAAGKPEESRLESDSPNPCLKTLEDRLRILNWHHSNSLAAVAKRLVGLEVFSILPSQEVDWASSVFNQVFPESPLTLRPYARALTFFASSLAPDGYDTSREVFVGSYDDLSRPQAVVSGKPGYSIASRGNNIASLRHFLELKPGEEKTIVYVLGVTDKPSLIPETVEHYRVVENVEKAFQELGENWGEYLGKLTVETPDEEMNAMINLWNAVQCRANLYWSRFVSLYDTGLGRGMGTRDSAQDTLGTVHNDPQHARRVLKMLWKLQFKDGHTWHQVFPLTGEGGPGHAAESPEKPQWFSDDHLWLILATCSYLRETGDFTLLDEKLPYQDSDVEETVSEHVERAVGFTCRKRGFHGLPLIGFADWDDTMNLDHGSEKAESVWTGMLFCRVMLDLAELCKKLGRVEKMMEFEKLHREMAETINRVSWDGEWYARAYDDEGRPVGVKGEKYHWISLIPQAWSAIAELGEEERSRKALESARRFLNTPLGLRLMRDPFNSSKTDEDSVDVESLRRFGGTATYPPGLKENGGIFNHANTWAIVAAAKLGLGDLAYQFYRQIMPLRRRDMDALKTEPYVYSQNLAAPEHPEYGCARNSWLTGTASWVYVAATQWILGIRPTFEGLKISPCIPGSWSGFNARRVFRGVTYNIFVKRVGKGSKLSLKVNGKNVPGEVVPLPTEDVASVEVEVALGGQ